MSASVVAAGADRLDFGRVPVTGRPRSRTVTLFNRRDVPASVRAVGIVGPAAPDFAIGSDRCAGAALAPDERCTVEIRFSPSERGERAARLTVHADAGPAGEVALSGTGI